MRVDPQREARRDDLTAQEGRWTKANAAGPDNLQAGCADGLSRLSGSRHVISGLRASSIAPEQAAQPTNRRSARGIGESEESVSVVESDQDVTAGGSHPQELCHHRIRLCDPRQDPQGDDRLKGTIRKRQLVYVGTHECGSLLFCVQLLPGQSRHVVAQVRRSDDRAASCEPHRQMSGAASGVEDLGAGREPCRVDPIEARLEAPTIEVRLQVLPVIDIEPVSSARCEPVSSGPPPPEDAARSFPEVIGTQLLSSVVEAIRCVMDFAVSARCRTPIR